MKNYSNPVMFEIGKASTLVLGDKVSQPLDDRNEPLASLSVIDVD